MNAILKPERDINDAADGALRQDAIDNLTDRLKTGGSVGNLDLRDLLFCEFEGERCDTASQDAISILLTEYPDRELLVERFINTVIERHLATHPDLIEEEAAAIERDREEDLYIDAQIDRAIEEKNS